MALRPDRNRAAARPAARNPCFHSGPFDFAPLPPLGLAKGWTHQELFRDDLVLKAPPDCGDGWGFRSSFWQNSPVQPGSHAQTRWLSWVVVQSPARLQNSMLHVPVGGAAI